MQETVRIVKEYASGRSRGRGHRRCQGFIAERLERRMLLTASQSETPDAPSFRLGGCPVCGSGGCVHLADPDGLAYYACHYEPSAETWRGIQASSDVIALSLEDTFSLSSRSSASKTIYLDFTGHTTSETSWQRGATFVTPAFSLDANYQAFSDAEKLAIQDVWARVSEDFSIFDVNVTTAEPPLGDLARSGPGDDRWGMRVVIGGDGSWMSGAAGVAYLGSFDWSSDTPCFVFADQNWKTNRNFMATCISHEVGHTLGLGHDGHNGSEYYGGRGSGETSWGPIMGNPGSVNLTQWSRGDYGGATNKEDDLAIIATRNGFGFRPDDHGDSRALATTVPAGASFTAFGVIGSSADQDVFAFTTNGLIDIAINPLAVGANLDVHATISDATGVIAESNPSGRVAAAFSLAAAPGTYYLTVRGTGMGDPATVGYSAYGSIGQYSVTGLVTTDSSPTLAVEALAADAAEGDAGETEFTFLVTRSGQTTGEASVHWQVAGAAPDSASASDFANGGLPSGVLTFADGESSKLVSVYVAGDLTAEPDERFTVTLSAPVRATISVASAAGVIRNDDEQTTFEISAQAADRHEGNSGVTFFEFLVSRVGGIKGPGSVGYRVAGKSVNPAAGADFSGRILPSGTVSFAPGEVSKVLVIGVQGDGLVERDELFTVSLFSPVGGVLGTAIADGLIRNDDESPTIAISATSAEKSEGNSGLTPFVFTVIRTGGGTSTASVRWAVTGVGTSPATAVDFGSRAFPAGVVSFAVGETSKTIVVNVRGESIAEMDEQFIVTLSNPSGATVVASVASGLILNDDEVSRYSIVGLVADKPEGNGGSSAFTFEIRRAGNVSATASLGWSVAGSSPNPVTPGDFVGAVFPRGTLSFAAGETSKILTVNVSADDLAEVDEQFVVMLSGKGSDVFSPSWAVGLIRNDDEASVVSVRGGVTDRAEGNTGSTEFVYTVTRSGPLGRSAVVSWAVSGAGLKPATASDFSGRVLPSGNLFFGPGEAVNLVRFYVNGDKTVESDETFVIRLRPAAGLTIDIGSALGTIINDDGVSLLHAGAVASRRSSKAVVALFASYPPHPDERTVTAAVGEQDD